MIDPPLYSRRVRVALIGAVLALLALAAALPAAGPAPADERIPAAGNGEDAWIIIPDAGKLTLLARDLSEPPLHFHQVIELAGRLAPAGVADGPQKLYLVYENMMVQSVVAGIDPDAPQVVIAQPRVEAGLPVNAVLLSLAATKGGLFALMEIKDQATLTGIDASPPTQPATDSAPAEPPATEPASGTPGGTGTPGAPGVDAVRLLRLDGNQWIKVSLPDALTAQARAWLVAVDPQAEFPQLVVEPPEGDHHSLSVYRRTDKDAWATQAYAINTDGQVVVMAVEGQVVVGLENTGPERLSVALSILRPERPDAIPLGDLSVDAPTSRTWGLLHDGLTIDLIHQDHKGQLFLTAMDMRGQLLSKPTPLVIIEPPPFTQDPSHMVMVAVVALSILMMFFIWRRDPAWNKLTLPKGVLVADLVRRAGAAAVDVVPCLIVTMVIFRLDLDGLQRAWPGSGGDWATMEPGLVAIALLVLHTGVSELLTAKSLGKWMFGLSVMTMQGTPPNVWQVLARNVLKAFDLVAWYVLPVLVAIGPYRQRLGDMVVRTVVVRPESPDKEEPAGDGLGD